MDFNENDQVTSDEEVTQIQEPVSESEAPKKEKKKKEKKKKPVSRRTAEERRTMSLLVAILAVGMCLLCVSLVGMMGVMNGIPTAPETTTAAPVVQNDVNQAVTTTQPNNAVQATPGETGTTAPNGDNTATYTTPQTDAEWLTFFNNAVNKLKTDAPAMTKTKQTKTADIQLSNSLGQAYVSSAKDKFLSDEVVETPIAKGDTASAQANVSPDGAAYVSSLTMSDIKSISHTTDANGNYVITVAMNDASNPDLSSAYGKIFEFMLVDDVMNTYAPDMGATVDRSNVELKYSNCSAVATVSPDGKVVSYQTTVNANMILKDAKISVITTDLDATLFSETKYFNIAW